jgi:hypothetical protein
MDAINTTTTARNISIWFNQKWRECIIINGAAYFFMPNGKAMQFAAPVEAKQWDKLKGIKAAYLTEGISEDLLTQINSWFDETIVSSWSEKREFAFDKRFHRELSKGKCLLRDVFYNGL